MVSGGRKSFQAQLVIRVPQALADILREEAGIMGVSVSDLARMTLSAMYVEDAPTKLEKLLQRRTKEIRKLIRAKLKER